MTARRLITRPFSGLSARWTSNYGSGNQFSTKAFYRYSFRDNPSEATLLLDAQKAFVEYLAGQGEDENDPSGQDTVVGNYIRSKTHLTGYYGQVLLQNVTARVVTPGLIEMTAVFVGEEAFDSSVSADTIMIYTAGGVTNANFGIPDSRLINQFPEETPQNIDLNLHIGGDALTRAPFTRSIIQYTPLVIDQNGPYDQGWASLVGKVNSDKFYVPVGPDAQLRWWNPNRVRLDGFQTSPRPLLEADGGVAWATRYQFSICSTAWVNQAIETFTDNEDNVRGRIIYEDQYQRAPFPYLYS